MSRTKNLLKNTGILIIAKMSTQVVSFLLLPLYTALLSTEQYGEIDIYTSLAMIVIPFLTLQIEMGMFLFFIKAKNRTTQTDIISSSFAMIALDILIVSIMYFIITIFIPINYRIPLYLYYLSMAFSSVLLQVCRAQGDNATYGMASFVSSGVAIGLNALFVVGFHWKVEGIIYASIIAQLVSVLFMLWKTKVHEYVELKGIKRDQCVKLLNYSFPLVLNQVSSWGINYSNRLIIISYLGIGINGIYSLANKFSNLTNMFFGMYNLAWTESVVRSMEDEDRVEYLSKMVMMTFNIYLLLITGMINLLPFVFDVLVNQAYADAYNHIPILLCSMFFSGMAATIGSIFIAYNRTKNVSITTTLAALCNILIHIMLLKNFQLYASSISSLVAFFLLFVYRYIFVQKIVPLQFQISKIVIPLAVLVISFIAYVSKNPWFILLGFALNLIDIGYLIYANKDIIVKFLKR